MTDPSTGGGASGTSTGFPHLNRLSSAEHSHYHLHSNSSQRFPPPAQILPQQLQPSPQQYSFSAAMPVPPSQQINPPRPLYTDQASQTQLVFPDQQHPPHQYPFPHQSSLHAFNLSQQPGYGPSPYTPPVRTVMPSDPNNGNVSVHPSASLRASQGSHSADHQHLHHGALSSSQMHVSHPEPWLQTLSPPEKPSFATDVELVQTYGVHPSSGTLVPQETPWVQPDSAAYHQPQQQAPFSASEQQVAPMDVIYAPPGENVNISPSLSAKSPIPSSSAYAAPPSTSSSLVSTQPVVSSHLPDDVTSPSLHLLTSPNTPLLPAPTEQMPLSQNRPILAFPSRATYHDPMEKCRHGSQPLFLNTDYPEQQPPSAIVPTLNYILGLDGITESQPYTIRPRLKPAHAPAGLSQGESAAPSSLAIQLDSSQQTHPQHIQPISPYPRQPAAPGLLPNADTVRRHHHLYPPHQRVEVQRILQSIPPTFPRVPATHYQQIQQNVSINSAPDNQIHLAPSQQAPFQYSTKMSADSFPPVSERPRRDALLWKLFFPQPTIVPKATVSAAPVPASPRALTPPRSFNVGETAEAQQSPRESIDDVPATGRLLIVVRRLPDKIIPFLNRPTESASNVADCNDLLSPRSMLDVTNKRDPVKLDATDIGVADELVDGTFGLELKDIASIEWTISRNEFGLDFGKIFPNDLRRVVVTDPCFPMNRLSKDPAVQEALRGSLANYLEKQNIIMVSLDENEVASTEKYSEEVLAPLFHHRVPPLSTGFHHLDWAGYKELNRAFFDTIVKNFKQGDWILIFNYHLMLLPKMLRDCTVTRDVNIGFYLGSVFPSSEMYRILPQREDLLRGVLAATFIGFHGFQYKRHFLTACTRVLGVECSGDRIEPNAAVGGGAGARVVTVPRGINPHPWLKELKRPPTQTKIAELREKFKGRKGHTGNQDLTGVDQEAWISRVDRREILANLYQLVGSINANFGSILNQPVHFLLSPLSVENLVCLYGLADIAVITPLREALSWAAYEFVLCQSYTNKGVIILSEFSGSAQSLGAAALCINPWDSHALAAAIHDALVMSDEVGKHFHVWWPVHRQRDVVGGSAELLFMLLSNVQEKLERHEYAFDHVLNYDAQAWGTNVMIEFREAVLEMETEKRSIPPKLPLDSLIMKAYQDSVHRILILGLRGALLPTTYRGLDQQLVGRARLSRSVESALQVLSRDENTSILIVSSSPISVVSQALEHFKGITLMAENGHFERPAKPFNNTSSPLLPATHQSEQQSQLSELKLSSELQNGWILTTPEVDLSWMDPVEDSCHYFEQRTPGSSVLRTATSVTFNYYNTQREHGANQARDLLIHLWAGPATLAARTDIVVGPSSVEVRSAACSKASAVEKWIHEIFTEKHLDPSKCMILCAANFLPRDEDVFAILERAIGVGDETTASATSQRKPSSEFMEHPALSQDELDAITYQQHGRAEILTTCTVGLKPSRANYCISNEKEMEQLMVLLASLSIIENSKLREKLSQSKDHSSNYHHILSPTAASNLFAKTLVTAGHKGIPGRHQIIANTFHFDTLRQHPELQRLLVALVGSSLSERHGSKQLSSPPQQPHKESHDQSVKSPEVLQQPPLVDGAAEASSPGRVYDGIRASGTRDLRRGSAPGYLAGLEPRASLSFENKLEIDLASGDLDESDDTGNSDTTPPTDEEEDSERELEDMSSIQTSSSVESSRKNINQLSSHLPMP